MLSLRLIVLCTGLALPIAAGAQNRQETLADIRKEVNSLSSEVQSLRSEMIASAGQGGPRISGTTLQRLDLIEAELQRLTNRTEELGHRIGKMADDAANRIGDLEFRLTELEGGDPTAAGAVAPLGGGGAAPSQNAPKTSTPARASAAAQKAVGEQADFDRARAVLDQRDFRTAAGLFTAFAESYPAGALTGEAHYYRGEALAADGDTLGAAKAYLESYSGWPRGERASESLLKLGTSLGDLGQTNDACTTLSQVSVLYPDTPAVAQATTAMQKLGCN